MKWDDKLDIFLASTLSRREVLALLGSAVANVWISGCDQGHVGSMGLTSFFSKNRTMTSMPPCIVRPEQTEGPYFVDEKLNRSDIRSDPFDGSVKEGQQLGIALRVHEIQGNKCLPISGALVDIWHCDARGEYSDVRDRTFNTIGRKFLRGHQISDVAGTVNFRTIYPGWYPGRAVHIHFKIRTDPDSRRGYEFTSQIYFEDSLSDQIHSNPPYNAPKGGSRLKNRQDGIFQDGGDELILRPIQGQQGYSGIFDIGLILI